MDCLVDTNIISELSRPRPNAGVLAWAQHIGRLGHFPKGCTHTITQRMVTYPVV